MSDLLIARGLLSVQIIRPRFHDIDLLYSIRNAFTPSPDQKDDELVRVTTLEELGTIARSYGGTSDYAEIIRQRVDAIIAATAWPWPIHAYASYS